MTEEELAMKDKLKAFNFSDEKIIMMTREAREKQVERQAQIDAAAKATAAKATVTANGKVLTPEEVEQYKKLRVLTPKEVEEVEEVGTLVNLIVIVFFGVIAIFIIYFFYIPTYTYDENNKMSQSDYLSCIEQNFSENYDNNCIGRSVKITAFYQQDLPDDQAYIFNPSQNGDYFRHRESKNFLVKGAYVSEGKFEIKGTFQQKSWLNEMALIDAFKVKKVDLTEIEATEQARINKRNEYERSLGSAEDQIANAWNKAIKSRDKSDAILNTYNASKREDLKSRAISHKRINNGSVMTDGYTMPDGSLTVCHTKVNTRGPATLDCY